VIATSVVSAGRIVAPPPSAVLPDGQAAARDLVVEELAGPVA
jgi:hypothetical protein